MDTIREEFDIKREKIHSLVGVFYQSTYKTFYVNTVDSATFIKPVGVFVSLGITTSKKTLNDIRTIIENHGYKAVIAEISSVQDKNSGKFLNKLVNTQNPEQYHIENYDKNTVMDEKQSKEELNRLKSLLTVDQDLNVLKEVSPKVSRMIDLIGKLDPDGWNYHYIQKTNNDYHIFHRYINYRKEKGVEYRIGIFVSQE